MRAHAPHSVRTFPSSRACLLIEGVHLARCRYAKFISEALEANGSGFICGPKPTIADCNFV